MKILLGLSIRRFFCLATLIGLGVLSLGGRPAAADALRWLPSTSPGVVGYKLFVGSESGFYAAGQVDRIVDIGSDFTLIAGIASHPLENLISGPAWLVMTAYDGAGSASPPSNQLFRDLPESCASDSDCYDGTVCNGEERCNLGFCSVGTPLQCDSSDPCNVGRCDPVNGCAADPVPNGTVCNDGDATTEGDRCEAGACYGNVVETRVPADYTSPEPITLSFDLTEIGQDPPGWFDTGAFNSLSEANLFEVMALSDGNKVFGTRSESTNIHSHWLIENSDRWSGYEVNGRMRVANATAGIGITLYSDYPRADAYYRLRRFDSGSFHFALHGGDLDACVGDTDTGVTPSGNVWYSFRFRAFDDGDGTRLQAKVWSEGSAEPGSWLADCLDASTTRRLGGAPGVWSMGSGEKYWDDLAVVPLPPASEIPPADVPECVSDADCGDSDACTGVERCVDAACFDGTPLECADPGACRVATCDAFAGCAIEPMANGTVCGVGDFCTAADTCFDGVCSAGAALACPDPGACLIGRCDPTRGCESESMPDGSYCDDGNIDTLNDSCGAGVCRGTLLPPPPDEEPQPDPDEEPQPDPDQEPPPTERPPIGDSGRLLFDFEDVAAGEDPPGWLDTRDRNSLAEGNYFAVFKLADGDHVFGTNSKRTNIHSHFVAQNSVNWFDYEFRGRMLINRAAAGIGVTLYSDYPSSDSYYRLRHQGTEPFHLANHPDGGEAMCQGVTTTSVQPKAYTWYAFRFQAFDAEMSTRLRAKVWAVDEPEPEQWQIDCLAPADAAFFSGSPGLWSMSRGGKFWDDLEMIELDSSQLP